MVLLPVILVVMGVICLFLGWRWQDPPSEEAITALKGLAYLKRELLQVKDHVYVLEEKLKRINHVEPKVVALKETEGKERNKLYVLNTQDQVQNQSNHQVQAQKLAYHQAQAQSEITPKSISPQPMPNVQQRSNMSPKYREVLVLAERGQSIPQISQHLSLSQDAVTMVLKMQSKGANR